jgi:hypothetical protein
VKFVQRAVLGEVEDIDLPLGQYDPHTDCCVSKRKDCMILICKWIAFNRRRRRSIKQKCQRE